MKKLTRALRALRDRVADFLSQPDALPKLKIFFGAVGLLLVARPNLTAWVMSAAFAFSLSEGVGAMAWGQAVELLQEVDDDTDGLHFVPCSDDPGASAP